MAPEIVLRNYDSVGIFLLTIFEIFFQRTRTGAYDGRTTLNELLTLCYICHDCRVSDGVIDRQLRADMPEFSQYIG